MDQKTPSFVWGTWENKPCNLNATAWFRSVMPWPIWAVYRTFSLTRPIRLSWPHLYRQFGADPSRASDKRTVDAFRTDCLRELKKIKTAWPELNYALGKGVLVLGPSEPSIPRNDP